MKWSPKENCGKIIEKFEWTMKKSVSCQCGTVFCFACQEEEHEPAACPLLEKWAEKEKSDSENLTWIKANTKPCPGCKGAIEKNQGCMHMTCRKCKAEFCWLCLGFWKTHGSETGGWYKCNIYDKLKGTDKEFAA